jgi:subunit length determinant Wzz-like protein
MPGTEKRIEPATNNQRGEIAREVHVVVEREPSAAEPDTISIGTLLSAVWQARLYVSVGLILGGLLGGVVAFAMTSVYRGQVIAVPVRHGGASGLSDTLGQFSGLAAIAGLDVYGADNTVEYLEFLKSRTLTQRFITDNILLPVLYSDLWDQRTKTWHVKHAEDTPTINEAVRMFNRRIRSVSQDKRTSVVTITIDWRDRQQAALWANEYLELANRELGRRAVVDAQSTLNYLNNELPRASSIGVQQALYHLIEDQQKTIALANTRREFAFKAVDQAIVAEPDDLVRPNRPLIIIALAIGGALVGLAVRRLLVHRTRSRAHAVE